MSNFLKYRRQVAQGLIAKETKKSPSSKKEKPESGLITLDEWFAARHKEMTGKCQHCGGKSQKNQLDFKCSIAHILPKKPTLFPSVATHPDNWIELCYYGKSCHTNFDNHIIDIIDLNCFDLVIEKFIRIYPFIAPKERRNIPDVLLQYIQTT